MKGLFIFMRVVGRVIACVGFPGLIALARRVWDPAVELHLAQQLAVGVVLGDVFHDGGAVLAHVVYDSHSAPSVKKGVGHWRSESK